MDHDTRHAAHQVAPHQIAQGLGWFSVALGAVELAAPDTLARLIGARPHSALVRAYGAREMAAGLGILSGRATPEWLWARVAGDAVDLGTLWLAAEERGADHARIGMAAGGVGCVTLVDLAPAGYLSEADRGTEAYVEPAIDMPIT